METYSKPSGITLVDMLLAVTIVAVLTTIVLTVATSIQNKASQQRCEGILATINTALQQYKEFGYDLPLSGSMIPEEIAFYRSLKFPPDCNEYQRSDVEDLIEDLLDRNVVVAIIDDVGEDFDPNNIAVMYFFLNRIPKCRETLNEIDPEYIVCTQNSNGDYQSITIRAGNNDRVYPWQRIVDPWGNALMYDYYVNQNEDNSLSYDEMQETLRNFPLVTSAGPDGIFNTDDDIYNRIETRSTEYKP